MFRSLEIDGTVIPEEALSQSRLIIDGDRFSMISPEANYYGNWTFELTKEPYWIDMNFTEGAEAGNSSYGVFRFHEDELIICLGLTGVPRPSTFSTEGLGGVALETLYRIDRNTKVIEEATRKDPKTPQGEAPVVTPDDFEVIHPELKQFEGEWRAVSIIRDGVELPKMMIGAGQRIGKSNETTVKFGPSVFMKAKTRIDPAASPAEIDYLLSEGPSKGSILLGIYKVEGNLATFCMAEPGLPRPTTFSSLPESKITLSTWKK